MSRLFPWFAALLLAGQLSTVSRPIVVIGDLHMGPGRDASGNWHAVEDFRWRDEFLRFLEALNAEGGNTDLVINGDLFELLQSPTTPCRHTDARFGCTVADALQRLDVVTTAHQAELAAIGKFAMAGSNRVHVVPGDHDAALLIPEVWQRAVQSFAAPADRIVLAASGSWRSPDGRVHVEHGHQLPLSADRFSNWPNPVIADSGRAYVERPWGERAILPLYDRTEVRYPIVDNIAEEGVGAKLVAAAGGVDQSEIGPLLRLLLTKTTWQRFEWISTTAKSRRRHGISRGSAATWPGSCRPRCRATIRSSPASKAFHRRSQSRSAASSARRRSWPCAITAPRSAGRGGAWNVC